MPQNFPWHFHAHDFLFHKPVCECMTPSTTALVDRGINTSGGIESYPSWPLLNVRNCVFNQHPISSSWRWLCSITTCWVIIHPQRPVTYKRTKISGIIMKNNYRIHVKSDESFDAYLIPDNHSTSSVDDNSMSLPWCILPRTYEIVFSKTLKAYKFRGYPAKRALSAMRKHGG